MTSIVAKKAASTPASPATYPFGVQWNCPFDPTTATTMQNCMILRSMGGPIAL
jgi:hypothetical protein